MPVENTFYEFFAGGGMARIGLGSRWRCLFANDFSEKKGQVYRLNFPEPENILDVCDVSRLSSSDLPKRADLVWGSFPCQDLSLAGNGAGLSGQRSGAFWPFWSLIIKLVQERRAPKVLVLENVTGAITSHSGADFASIITELTSVGYRVGALTIDAIHFLPQSRPRLFFIAIHESQSFHPSLALRTSGPKTTREKVWYSDALLKAQAKLSASVKSNWVWWNLLEPPSRSYNISDLLESSSDARWDSAEATTRLLGMMSPLNLEKVRLARSSGIRSFGTVYKRTRAGVQRAEVRFDGVSGCLRTPEGGSSRQTILEVHGSSTRSRLLSTKEAARLMGLPETYLLPSNYNDAYHITGDGLAVPVVSWLEQHLLSPLLDRYEPVDRIDIRHCQNKEDAIYA